MSRFTLFLSGVLFALGLALGGMTDADKVIGFLDVTRGWDPSLAFVMIGAIAVHAVLYPRIVTRTRPRYARAFVLPARRDISPRLLVGAVLFGAGWALGGYCPGPGLVSVVAGAAAPLVFVVTMTTGWWLAARIDAGMQARADG